MVTHLTDVHEVPSVPPIGRRAAGRWGFRDEATEGSSPDILIARDTVTSTLWTKAQTASERSIEPFSWEFGKASKRQTSTPGT